MFLILSGIAKLIGFNFLIFLLGFEFLKSGANGPIFPLLAICFATSFKSKPNCFIKPAVS